MIKNLELKFTSNDKFYLKTVIMKAVKKKVKNMNLTQFSDEDANIGNLNINTKYIQEKILQFKIKVIKNQGVPLHQIEDLFVIEIDKEKIDPTTAIPEPEKPTGGDLERIKDLNNKIKD